MIHQKWENQAYSGCDFQILFAVGQLRQHLESEINQCLWKPQNTETETVFWVFMTLVCLNWTVTFFSDKSACRVLFSLSFFFFFFFFFFVENVWLCMCVCVLCVLSKMICCLPVILQNIDSLMIGSKVINLFLVHAHPEFLAHKLHGVQLVFVPWTVFRDSVKFEESFKHVSSLFSLPLFLSGLLWDHVWRTAIWKWEPTFKDSPTITWAFSLFRCEIRLAQYIDNLLLSWY